MRPVDSDNPAPMTAELTKVEHDAAIRAAELEAENPGLAPQEFAVLLQADKTFMIYAKVMLDHGFKFFMEARDDSIRMGFRKKPN